YNTEEFMDASILDFSYLHRAQADEHGFVFAGTDGHFYFQDGTRARFWGINVAKESVFQSDERIDEAVRAISRAGFNLVRIHHIDGVGGLLPSERAANPDRIDPEKLDRVDYWIYRLKQAGIYVYLDLLDFRTFFEEERVTNAEKLGRGAKPYAVFDNHLIELQQQYARHLLIEHTNPYTGLSYAEDPTVCMIEICDENGLYFSRSRWGDLVEPYASDLRRRFNEWLQERYGNTLNLAEAWTDFTGDRGLLEGENLEEGTVWLFPEARYPGRFVSPGGESPRLQRGRAADRRLFIDHIHSEYLRRMKTYLRRRGVKVPITAVLDFNHVADMRTVAESLDFMGTNFYYDHPLWRKGNEWHLPAFHENRNPISDPRTETFVPRMLVSRIWGVPSVVREWNVCWPNHHRAAGMLEAAAYSTLQDLDAVILFTYDLIDGKRRIEFFDVSTDPVRWGLQGLCAKMYLQRDVRAAKHSTAMAFSRVDSFYPTWQPMPTEAYKLGWVSRFYTLFFDEEVPKEQPDILMASGRSASGVYDRNRAILCSNWPTEDLHDHKRDQSLEEKAGYQVATVPGDHGYYTFGGTMFSAGQTLRFLTDPAFLVADVKAQNYRPIGSSRDRESCVGFRDTQRDNYVFRRLTAHQKLRCALDALKQIYDAPVSHDFVDRKEYRSDTRQIERNIDDGVLTVQAPHFQAIGGNLSSTAARTETLDINSDADTGTVVWTSFDGKGPAASTHWMIKMVTVAENTGQAMKHHHSNAEKTVYRLEEMGDTPIRTNGRNSSTPTVVSLNGRDVLRVWLHNGLWELVYENGRYYFNCDTADVKIELPDLPDTVEVSTIGTEPPERSPQNQPLKYGASFSLLSMSP
ncbi:MAG: hypothetical protein ACLFWB_13785, partial [Armatimonadota bacterium]